MEQDLLPIIRDIQFLHDFPDDYLEPLASVARVQDYPAGAIAFREGQKETRLYLIIKGVVSLEFCTPGLGCKRFQTVGAGELLGWSPILGLTEVTATARVLEPAKLLVIDAHQLAALCEHNPRFGYEFMRRTALALSHRLSATRLQLLDVYQHELPVVTDRGEG
jgi:CRP/FNR family cyclic AMP-dependent transcriptional regulator